MNAITDNERETAFSSIMLVNKNKKLIGSMRRPEGDSTKHVIVLDDGRTFKYNGTILYDLVYEECETVSASLSDIQKPYPEHINSIKASHSYKL